MIPSWAIGFAFIIAVVAAAQVVVRRLVGPANRGAWQNPTEPDVARLTQALDDVQRSEEHTSELQSHHDLVCRLLLEKKKKIKKNHKSYSNSRMSMLNVQHCRM